MVDEEINELLPSHLEHGDILEAHEQMKTLALATKLLQDPKIDLLKSRTILDMAVSKFPLMKGYLKKDADIVKCPLFESAICKILSRTNLSPSENNVMDPFKYSYPVRFDEDPQEEVIEQEPDAAREFLIELDVGGIKDRSM